MRILPLAMPKFIARYPNVSLELRETGSVRMEDLLRYGEIDLAFATVSGYGTGPAVSDVILIPRSS